jgi:hypothetical protein
VTHPPGAIIFAGGEFLRFSGFMFSLLKMEKPDRTQIIMKQSVSLVENLNDCIRGLNDESQWIWIQSDDQLWEPDALTRQLDHELDVVVPLILQRSPPFSSVVFKERTEDGYLPFRLEEIPEEELFAVHAAGTGGMLVRRPVLDAIGEPWFSYEDGIYLNEDLTFSNKIRRAGFTIWCDPTVRMGHRATYSVWPVYDSEGWGIGMNMGQSKEDGRPNQMTIRPRKEEAAV